jgi:hypothetical protein
MGPIMQMVNALNDPKKAMTDENSGIAIETMTEAIAEAERLKARFENVLDIGVVS